MSIERSLEPWEELQRQSYDFVDKLAQGFTGLIPPHITPPSIPWASTPRTNLFDVEFKFPTQNIVPRDFTLAIDSSGISGVLGIFGIGHRIGQAGADLGASLNGLVQQFFRSIPVPFLHNDSDKGLVRLYHEGSGGQRNDMNVLVQEELSSLAEQLGDLKLVENEAGVDGVDDEELSGFNLKLAGLFGKSQGTANVTSTYDSRTHDIQSSVVARGDSWRLEAASGTSTPGTVISSLILVQYGALLYLRDSTLLFPVQVSKQHLLWYGYNRKNGLHSLCPVVWSKHTRWRLMSMICLNPMACSFMDLQFPNGYITYAAGEGLSTSAFLPICGGLLQAQGQYPGEMKFSFSCKNKWGTRITPMMQWPDKSIALGFEQDLAWKRSGLLMRPTIQFSLCPTYGGSDPGVRAELVHSVKEQLSLVYGCSYSAYPTAFASVSLGRSKWNGNVGSTGIVVRVETPLSNVARPSFSVQLNSGFEF